MNDKRDDTPDVLKYTLAAFTRGTPEAAWAETAHALFIKVSALGRLPRAGDPGVDARLLSWVKNQRRNKLNHFQRAYLELIPGWTWSPRDDHWDKRFGALQQFHSQHGRSPRIRATDADERSLATWAARQRRAAQEATLPYPRFVRWRALTACRHDCVASDLPSPPGEVAG